MLDDPDVPTRELALSLLVEILEKHIGISENPLTVTTYFLHVPLLNVIFHENDPRLAFSVQRKAMESCIEILIVKLLHATKDAALKVIHLMLVSACIS